MGVCLGIGWSMEGSVSPYESDVGVSWRQPAPVKKNAKCNSEMRANKTIIELPATNKTIAKCAEKLGSVLPNTFLAGGLARKRWSTR